MLYPLYIEQFPLSGIRFFVKVTAFDASPMKRAVFIDRDGTISEEMGYINHVDRFCLFPWSAPAIRTINEAGLPAVLVTNQAGLARGYFTENLLKEVHAKLTAELQKAGARLDGIYYCPHHPEGAVQALRTVCECRKPKTGMLLQASRDLDLDLASSFVVGDTYRDLEMGFRVGATSILVLSGYGKGEYLYRSSSWARQPDFIAADLGEAADWVLASL